MGSRSTITSIRKNNNNNGGGSNDDNNGDANNNIHTALLSGKLSINVVDVDIRRDLTNLSAKIESDYILKINILGGSTATTLAEHHVLKHYVDNRNLASTLREYAEEVVKVYASFEFKSKSSSSSSSSGIGGYLNRFTHYISGINSSEQQQQQQHHTAIIRTSNILNTRAPIYIRAVLAGIDEYYEIINSVKRQKGPKQYTNWQYVQGMTELRRTRIDSAFSSLIQALASANLSDQLLLPAPLLSVIHALETFLLTDVIVDHHLDPEKEKVSHNNITSGVAEEVIAAQPQPTSKPTTLFESVVTSATAAPRPKTTRRRSSCHERMTMDSFHNFGHEAEIVTLLTTNTMAGVGGVASITNYSTTNITKKSGGGGGGLLLPHNPTQFGIVFAFGVTFCKAIEGYSMSNIRLDLLVLFGIVCGVLGYQLGCHWMIVQGHKDIITATTSHQLMKMENENVVHESLMSRIQQTSDSLSLGSREQTGDLLRRSLNFMGARVNPETTIIPTKTYAKFPEGAKIGSHSSCWSVPPCTNFHVRGPNYLKDKVKVSSGEFLFPCRGCDLFLTDNAPINIGRNRNILGGTLRDVPTFIINYRLPWGVFISYYEIPERFVPFVRRGNGYGDRMMPLPLMVNMTAGERGVCNFLLSDSDTKNKLLKLIPMVVDGPWVVKKVVGGKPAMVGTKLPVSYVYQPPVDGLADYLEVDLDIVSSAAARNILAVVRSYTQVLTIDLGFCIQGQSSEELPEQMMLGLRLHGLNPLTAEYLHAFEEDMSTFIEGTASTATSTS